MAGQSGSDPLKSLVESYEHMRVGEVHQFYKRPVTLRIGREGALPSDPDGAGASSTCTGETQGTHVSGHGGAECSRNESIKNNLQRHFGYICRWIKPMEIIQIPMLFTEGERNTIRAATTEYDQNQCALSLLQRGQNQSGRFAQFRDAIRKDYPKLVDILDGNSEPNDENYVRIIELFNGDIRKRVNPCECLPYLMSRRVLNATDHQEILAEEKNYGAIRASNLLLEHLPRRITNWFEIFLESLRECGLDDLAEMLEQVKPASVKPVTTRKECGYDISKILTKNSPRIQRKVHCKIVSPTGQVKTVEDNVVELSVADYDSVKIETLIKSSSDRLRIDEIMVDEEAKICWPNSEEKEQIIKITCTLAKCRGDYAEKLIKWKKQVRKKFDGLINDFDTARHNFVDVEKKDSRRLCNLKKYFDAKDRVDYERETHTKAANDIYDKMPPEATYEVMPFSSFVAANGREIVVKTGPIEESPVDVMIIPADAHLRLQTGLAKTIRKIGGDTLQSSCRNYITRYNSMDESDILISEAGNNLPAKYVIFVVSPVWRDEYPEKSKKRLKKAVVNSLVQSSKKSASSASLPAIGCGSCGFPKKIGTSMIVRAVENYFREEPDTSLRTVYLMDSDDNIVKRFHQAAKECFTPRDDF